MTVMKAEDLGEVGVDGGAVIVWTGGGWRHWSMEARGGGAMDDGGSTFPRSRREDGEQTRFFYQVTRSSNIFS